MSNRSSIRRIENFEKKLQKRGSKVLNLCGQDFRLQSHQKQTESLSRCYASTLQNCTGPMSKEHYISENILRQLDTINQEGVPWLKGKVAIAPKNVFVANCLCKYHNGFLSPLDLLAGHIFGNFASFTDPSSPCILIWGPSLARWLLKCLVGFVASKNATVGGEKISHSDLPKEWIEILFGLKNFPKNQGLYMTPVIGTKLTFSKRFSLQTLNLEGQLKGVRINLAGIEFILSMADSEKAFNQNHSDFPNILYRPSEINLDLKSGRVKIFWE